VTRAAIPLACALLSLSQAACAAAPSVVDSRPPAPAAPAVERPASAPFIESPPHEPVQLIAQAPPPPEPTPVPPSQQIVPPPPAPPVAPPPLIVIAEPTAEEREFGALLADLQRYAALANDELRKEVTSMAQTVARTRNDASRVRLAVLYTLTRQTPQDDQRALQLLEQVAKSNPASAPVKQLAAVLSVQVAERVRAVKDEQARSEAALQKLEALRSMERSLLRDRIRSGGGGGGGGSGGN
jgi:hypothetical protein